MITVVSHIVCCLGCKFVGDWFWLWRLHWHRSGAGRATLCPTWLSDRSQFHWGRRSSSVCACAILLLCARCMIVIYLIVCLSARQHCSSIMEREICSQSGHNIAEGEPYHGARLELFIIVVLASRSEIYLDYLPMLDRHILLSNTKSSSGLNGHVRACCQE